MWRIRIFLTDLMHNKLQGICSIIISIIKDIFAVYKQSSRLGDVKMPAYASQIIRIAGQKSKSPLKQLA